MADMISAELAATCAALGFNCGTDYRLQPHALDVIKDLIKYLKRDDECHTVRQYLGHAKLLETDLKKIFIQFYANKELWDVLLRLLINLTSPALIVYNEELPSEKTNRSTYEQLVVYLQNYKVAFADDRVWSVVGQRLQSILNMDPLERGEDNEMILERILTLIRNVLQVPPNDNEIRAENDATVHDEVLFALHTSGLVDTLLFLASNASEQQYHIQVLEIITLMLREQCPQKLATAGQQRSSSEKNEDSDKLLIIRDREIKERMEKIKKYAGSRHSRFGGTFVIQNMKAIGDNQLLCHKPYQKLEALEFNQEKRKVKRSQRKMPMSDSRTERTSALSVRLFLKEFCVEFLNGAYNPLMRYAKSCINGGGVSEIASCYLWTLRFFMEFNRHYKFQVKFVSETISTEVFHLVQTRMEFFYEMMTTDKKKIPSWSKKLHLGVKAYQELLHTLAAMDATSDEGVRESSKIIKSNVFYVPEYRETILSQLLHYDDVKMSRGYLVDLLTTAHIFLKMLKDFCRHNRTLVVGKKKARRTQGKAKKRRKEVSQATSLPVKSLEEIWDEAAPEISAVMREGTIPVVVPFDATLEIPIDQQKSEAMKKIQIFLRKREFERAVGLLRASREVWPENDCFGKPDIPVEEEFLALREIFFAQLGVDIDYGNEEQREKGDDNKPEDEEQEFEDENDGDEEDEEENLARTVEETNFNFDEFLRRFANVKVVKSMALLLRQFDENSDQLNYYIVKMLHRIAFDCKMYGMMFQASIFRIFQRILDSKSSRYKELQKFAVFIIRKFTEVAARNPKVYMELLFWKSNREVTEMIEGYDAPTNEKVSRALWSEAEEDELRTLFMEHQTKNYSQDLVDWILENLISDNRTRRGVMKKLKEMCLVVNPNTKKTAAQNRPPKEWSEEEIAQLTELWEKVREDQDPVDTIHDALTVKRSKKAIKEKLLETGLANDRKELRKKRLRNGEPPKASWETKSASENSDESESESERAENRLKKASKPKKRQPSVVYTDEQLFGLLKDVIDKKMEKALEWLKESLEDIIEDDEDRDEMTAVDVPLVPLTEYSITAMESPSFQRLLRAISIEPPVDEQEIYWRVPGSISAAMITERCRLIERALSSGDTSFPGSNVEKLPATNNDEDSGFNVESIPVEKGDQLPAVDSDESSSGEAKRDRSQDSDTEMPLLKKRRVIISDDEDYEDANKSKVEDENSQQLNISSRRKLISDDEDDDN
ncbi:protein timeless homolog [Venturia canescens]|uniref:protein timeless homolog n=1 Tax=Venturia canescens TaxID=32260 RepID=UPI001C9CCE7D|nr:protein timeless homolog [Venturia canescens]